VDRYSFIAMDLHHLLLTGLPAHSCADPIPFTFGERLYAAAPEPKRFVRVESGSHSRNLEQGGMAAVEDFLAAIEDRQPDRFFGSAITPPQAP
jgi:hypothetical protein